MSKLKKTVISAMATGIAVGLSGLFIPFGVAKCFPVQHAINVLLSVLLGPYYAVMTAFVTSLLRNMLGIGTILAFPGSMVGALCASLFYRRTNQLPYAVLGEVFGTGLMGALIASFLTTTILGHSVAVFYFLIPFMVSAVVGAVIGGFLLRLVKNNMTIGGKKHGI